MNGDSTGLESADSGSSSNSRHRDAGDALRIVSQAKAIFEARGAWRLVREIEDETARWESEEAIQRRQLEVPLGRVDGENPQDAKKELSERVRVDDQDDVSPYYTPAPGPFDHLKPGARG